MKTYMLSLPAVAESIRTARAIAADAAAELGADDRVVDDVRLCVSEVVANVVLHAYEGTGDVALEFGRDGGEFVAIVRDSGVGLAGSTGREKIGAGLGMKIVEVLALRVAVTSLDDGGTAVRMHFRLAEQVTAT